MKKNLRFKQLRLNNLNKQKNKKKRPKISIKLYQGKCGFKSTKTIDFRLASVFLKNLKHLSYSILSVTILTFNR